jgi:hypothetical protein
VVIFDVDSEWCLQGMTVWEHGGNLAFVLFTGLSILPASLSLGDALTRG